MTKIILQQYKKSPGKLYLNTWKYNVFSIFLDESGAFA